ncbi:MAG: DMT family transporter [bacterium]|nr:DMT family transporter [bacterium]
MNFLLPLAAAVLQAGSFTLDKVALSARGMTFRSYIGVSFPLIALITLAIFLVVRPPIDPGLLVGMPLALLAVSIALTIIINLIFYRALDDDRLSELETIGLLQTFPVIILSSLVFADERNVAVITAAFVAALAIFWSHWEGRHFRMARHTVPFFLSAICLAPVGTLVARQLLTLWHPVALELVRSTVLALIFGFLFSRYTARVRLNTWLLLIGTNTLTSVAWLLYYFSYQRSGIIYTILLFSIHPLLVYFSSVFFLKEPLQWKKLAAFVVVLAAIVTAQIV